jgi:glucan 1,3-beta-glucosidase
VSRFNDEMSRAPNNIDAKRGLKLWIFCCARDARTSKGKNRDMPNVVMLMIMCCFFLIASGWATAFTEPLIGINYAPYHYEGQAPGTPISDDQMRSDLEKMEKNKFMHVKTYTVADGLHRLPEVAQREFPHLKFYLGVYENNCQREETRRQLDLAIQAANKHSSVVAIVVGHECLTGDAEAGNCPVTVSTLCSDMEYVKQHLKRSVIVTTDLSWGAAHDTHTEALKNCSHIDLWMINIYPYFKPSGILCNEREISINLDWNFREFNGIYGGTGKPIVVGEHGWPSAGEAYGISQPSIENEKNYFNWTKRWFRQKNWSHFYFEMFDQPWKSGEPGDVGLHWGLYDKDGYSKFPNYSANWAQLWVLLNE